MLSFRAIAISLITLLLVLWGGVSVDQQWHYRLPTDLVHWRMTVTGPEAVAFEKHADPALRSGDHLVAVDGQPVKTVETIERILFDAGIGGQITYTVARGDKPDIVTIPVRIAASQPPLVRFAFLETVALLYLALGVFIIFRRGDARQSLHFYIFCLASFTLYAYHYTGKLNQFDWSIYWANYAAQLLVPCLFLHFALRFYREGRGTRWWVSAGIYLPAALVLAAEAGLVAGTISLPVTLATTQDLLDRIAYLMFTAYFLAAALVFRSAAGRARAAIMAGHSGQLAWVGAQARWLARGTFAALVPFTVLWAAPYWLGIDLPRWTGAAALAMLCIPLAFCYAIFRYHLLEAEIMFRRGIVYTLAAVGVVVVYFGLIGVAAELIHSRLPRWGPMGELGAIVVTALLFNPLKERIQERIERLSYRERFDYRRTLMEFGRQINAQPELDSLLDTVLDRLAHTLSVERVAVLIEREGVFQLARARGIDISPALPVDGLRFLATPRAPGSGSLFFSDTASTEVSGLDCREAVRRLDLHYYVPCELKDRVVAYLGLGKTIQHEFLSREDLALVETLAGYLAVALDNARLYSTLRDQVREYERLKDFNENIVESIQVGVIAVDLAGRVDSWNAQMEVLSALPRHLVRGRSVVDLLGAAFAAEFDRACSEGGIRNVYKCALQLAGCDKIVNLAIAPLVTRRFEMVGRIVILEDVTAEVEMERNLIQADRLRAVGLLAAGVAHEVNTPLAVISSYAQLLAKQTPPGDPRATVLDKITRQTFRASEIVGNLLHFSRTGPAEFRAVDLNLVVRESLGLVEHSLMSAGIRVSPSLHPAPVIVMGDAGKLQQVFLNLILNARDAMPRGGDLQLRSELRDGRGWLEVEDSGEGIPPEHHRRIFDPFFTTKQSPRTNGTMGSGTGLGLAVTYGIVQEHGGVIQVWSEPGRGARFQLEFPVAAGQSAAIS